MRSCRFLSAAILAAGLLLPDGAIYAKRKARKPAVPALPSGGSRQVDAADAYYGGAKLDTIKTYVNRSGQTVYAIAASHFDVSPPLVELTASPSAPPSEETARSSHPVLPEARIIRSEVPDPVVEPVATAAGASMRSGTTTAAPATGFNFLGMGINGGSPSDSNGSVGNDQFVETVNTRYQVWSLDRSTHTATSILGPSSINTLWAGFGGACQTQNSGDPIVLYDKVANRWLISQFTTGAVSGVYFQCVAVSTTPNAVGSYARYAFAVPNNVFGDYPHFGAWTDAYYMMAHAFASTSGGYVAALFAAMDRKMMLLGDPAATWQVIAEPLEGGHLPADLDGFAPPPPGAPGVFVSLHADGMVIYRMEVDFAVPANTVKFIEATVPVAPATAACSGGTCIPQPGTTRLLDALSDRLMFRAAYRNFVDHESLVVSHSVDPSVSGLVSGVRWYDFRLSGSPDATCPEYPCLYQQGTIADTPSGRSRWMPSLAMDSAENILVGYSTTGKTAGSENHSLRYTGRAPSDPPGSMTVPEATLVTGTSNNSGNSRWGDYSSMSVDPFDDCTFWYVGQYYAALNSWSTRVASAVFPPGSGAGQCQPSACAARPDGAPVIGAATVPGDNQIVVDWTGIDPAASAYAVFRADGACGAEGMYRPLGATGGAAGTFTDTAVSGGRTYSYRVIAASDGSARCQALVASDCVSATATGACSLKPQFGGAASAASSGQNTCGVTVGWTPAVSSCPLTPSLRYNVYRGTVPGFVPSAANRIAICVAGPSAYLDTDNLASGTTYYYAVRAEDDSTGNGGPCGGGNEEPNTSVVAGTPFGSGTQAGAGTFTDGAGDGTAFLLLNVPGPGDTQDQPWRIVNTADDPGANHTPGGAYAYRNAGPGPANRYAANVCAEMQAPPLTAAATTVNLQYWERHQLEYRWDAIAVEYSIQGGAWTTVPAPSNSGAAGCAASDDVTGWETLSCTLDPPINACGYPASGMGFNGPLGSGTNCNDWSTAALTPYAHRCHPIAGVVPGNTIQFRWRFSSDPGAQFAGFYLDDVAVTNVKLPNACIPDTCPNPSEVAYLSINGHATTALSWTAVSGSVVYDVVSSTLSDLWANGTAAATCLANDIASTGTVDSRADPAPEEGYYYLVRAQGSCGSGTFGDDSHGGERAPTTGCP